MTDNITETADMNEQPTGETDEPATAERDSGQTADTTAETAANVKQKSTGAKVRKGFAIAGNVLIYLFLALCIFLLVVTLVARKNADGAINLFGYEMRIVTSSSMEKSKYSVNVDKYDIKDLKVKTMVFIERKPEKESEQQAWYGKLRVGDVLTFKYYSGLRQDVITHRIVDIRKTDNGYVISLQGDNRASADAEVATQTVYTSMADSPNPDTDMFHSVIGKVVGSSAVIGHIVYAIRQPIGLWLIIIVPCAIIIVWQIIRIILVLSEDKRKKQQAELESVKKQAEEQAIERDKNARELEELRRQVAELRQAQNISSDETKQGDDGGEAR